MRIYALCTLALLALLASVSQATPVTVKVEISVDSYYDYPSSTYIAMPAVTGVVAFTFDIDQISVDDYGTTTISTFGGINDATWYSPITTLIPNDPASGAYGSFYSSYVFPNVSDYDSTFIEEGASQANTYMFDGSNYAYYHIEIRASRYSPSRGGDGSSDYAFDRNNLLDFYRSFVLSGEAVHFNESYANYTIINGSALYSDGKSWSDYSGRIIEVTDHASTVPEPSTAALFASGLGLIALRHRRNSIKKHFVSPIIEA